MSGNLSDYEATPRETELPSELQRGVFAAVHAYLRARGDERVFEEAIASSLHAPPGFVAPTANNWKIYVADVGDVTIHSLRARAVIAARHTPIVRVTTTHVYVANRGVEVKLSRRMLRRDGCAYGSAGLGANAMYYRDVELDAGTYTREWRRIETVTS